LRISKIDERAVAHIFGDIAAIIADDSLSNGIEDFSAMADSQDSDFL